MVCRNYFQNLCSPEFLGDLKLRICRDTVDDGGAGGTAHNEARGSRRGRRQAPGAGAVVSARGGAEGADGMLGAGRVLGRPTRVRVRRTCVRVRDGRGKKRWHATRPGRCCSGAACGLRCPHLLRVRRRRSSTISRLRQTRCCATMCSSWWATRRHRARSPSTSRCASALRCTSGACMQPASGAPAAGRARPRMCLRAACVQAR